MASGSGTCGVPQRAAADSRTTLGNPGSSCCDMAGGVYQMSEEAEVEAPEP